MKPALLVIDVQNQFMKINQTTTQSLERAIQYINEAIKYFRAKNLPIFCIQHLDEEMKLAPGNWDFDTPETLNLLPTDFQIHKTYGNAFKKTPLEAKLRELGVDTVIITGFCAEACVLASALGAENCDFTAVLLRGSLASGEPENIHFVERISDLISLGALKAALEI